MRVKLIFNKEGKKTTVKVMNNTPGFPSRYPRTLLWFHYNGKPVSTLYETSDFKNLQEHLQNAIISLCENHCKIFQAEDVPYRFLEMRVELYPHGS